MYHITSDCYQMLIRFRYSLRKRRPCLTKDEDLCFPITAATADETPQPTMKKFKLECLSPGEARE